MRITVCVPTIPPRADLLVQRALPSVYRQTLGPDAVAVAVDHDHQGVWTTRQAALEMARTPLVANLDDDDEFRPQHLERLHAWLLDHDADMVFSWFDSAPRPGFDPLGHFGRVFDPLRPHLTTSVILVKRDLAMTVRYDHPPPAEWENAQDDWLFVLGAVAAGARIVHLPERTWIWHVDGHHTSGQPHRW